MNFSQNDANHKRNPTAAAFLNKIRGELRRSKAKWTGEYSYTIDQVVQEMIERRRRLQLRLGDHPEETSAATPLFLSGENNELYEGRHRSRYNPRRV